MQLDAKKILQNIQCWNNHHKWFEIGTNSWKAYQTTKKFNQDPISKSVKMNDCWLTGWLVRWVVGWLLIHFNCIQFWLHFYRFITTAFTLIFFSSLRRQCICTNFQIQFKILSPALSSFGKCRYILFYQKENNNNISAVDTSNDIGLRVW